MANGVANGVLSGTVGMAGGQWRAIAAPFAGRLAALRAPPSAKTRRLAAEAGFVWSPVILSCGIGFYFLPREEPGWLLLAALGCLTAALAGLSFRADPPLGIWALRGAARALALAAGGFVLMAIRAHMVAAPVLAFATYGPVEGRVIDVDRSFSDQIRVTLDQVRLPELAAEEPDAPIPSRVRISLHGEAPDFAPEPGARLRAVARLAPPDGAVAPGGFDFQRLAWFSSLGGVGYARDPVMILGPPDASLSLFAFRLRMHLSRAMQSAMGGGQDAAFAAALMTGDRSGVNQATNQALRASNLSHIISISGLHMGLLSGFVFALVRYGLALVPPLALRINGKKVAAAAALLAATFYMILAGPDVATRRSYIMAAVMLLAVLTDRRALSLRSVAMAALICLGLEPESLVEPGFQMSFGATAALIVGFDWLRRPLERLPKIARPVAMAVLSSVVAGTATTPIAAAHFNRIAEYGLVANLLSIPVMGFLVMPFGVLSALLAPLGLAAPALWVLKVGSGLILLIAERIAALDGALLPVVSPPPSVLPLIGLGGALLLIGPSRGVRAGGVLALAGSLFLWAGTVRPTLLISSDGTLAGVMTEGGRALSKPKGGGFIAEAWLQDDGDLATQIEAAARPGFAGPKGARQTSVAGRAVIILSSKGAADKVAEACTPGAIIILADRLDGPRPSACDLYDQRRLRRTGALALYAEPGGALRIVTGRGGAGYRLWNWHPRRWKGAPGPAGRP